MLDQIWNCCQVFLSSHSRPSYPLNGRVRQGRVLLPRLLQGLRPQRPTRVLVGTETSLEPFYWKLGVDDLRTRYIPLDRPPFLRGLWQGPRKVYCRDEQCCAGSAGVPWEERTGLDTLSGLLTLSSGTPTVVRRN